MSVGMTLSRRGGRHERNARAQRCITYMFLHGFLRRRTVAAGQGAQDSAMFLPGFHGPFRPDER